METLFILRLLARPQAQRYHPYGNNNERVRHAAGDCANNIDSRAASVTTPPPVGKSGTENDTNEDEQTKIDQYINRLVEVVSESPVSYSVCVVYFLYFVNLMAAGLCSFSGLKLPTKEELKTFLVEQHKQTGLPKKVFDEYFAWKLQPTKCNGDLYMLMFRYDPANDGGKWPENFFQNLMQPKGFDTSPIYGMRRDILYQDFVESLRKLFRNALFIVISKYVDDANQHISLIHVDRYQNITELSNWGGKILGKYPLKNTHPQRKVVHVEQLKRTDFASLRSSSPASTIAYSNAGSSDSEDKDI